MSKASTYYCPGCGYRVITTAGPAANFLSRVNTFVCLTCKEVKDKATHRIHRKVKEGSKLDLLGDPMEFVNKVDEVTQITCSECRATDLLLWDTVKKPCPRCNNSMKMDDNGIVIHAD